MALQDEQTKSHPPTGEAIPKGGFVNKLLKYTERVTGRRSLLNLLFQGIVFSVFEWIPTMFGSILRAIVYRFLVGGIGKSCLIDKHVRIAIPSKVFLGARVFIGEYSYIDPKSSRSTITLGNDVYISRLCRVSGGGSEGYVGEVIIGDSVHVGQNCFLDGTGTLKIGQDSLLGPNVVILTGNHGFRNPNALIRRQGILPRPTTIGEDVWLGANATILDGITVGKGSVVGAGSVVTRDIPPYSIAVGVPAKVIGQRGETDETG